MLRILEELRPKQLELHVLSDANPLSQEVVTNLLFITSHRCSMSERSGDLTGHAKTVI